MSSHVSLCLIDLDFDTIVDPFSPLYSCEMRLSFVILLPVALNVCLISSLQLARSISASAIHVSNISFVFSHHSNYIDYKIRKSTYLSLNHGSYHQRNVMPFPNNSVTAPKAATIVAMTSPTLLEASADISTSRHSSLVNVLPIMKATGTDDLDAEHWSNRVDLACTETLTLLNGRASNPSGAAACYNIRTLDHVTRIFDADLRWYRIAAPLGEWMQLNGTADVDVEFDGASLTMSDGRIGKRGVVTIEMPLVEGDAARDMWRRRAGGIMPKMFGNLTLAGIIGGNFIVDGISECVR
jgi:hypothetical protein